MSTQPHRSHPPSHRHIPVVGICGYSGSGKTTLIESLLPRLTARGLQVTVIKQDTHGLAVDQPGKDSDRLFKAGADVAIRDEVQALHRMHRRGADQPLEATLGRLAPDSDLILVEGHKTAPLDWKLWLGASGGDTPPPEAVNIRRILPWDAERVSIALQFIERCLANAVASTPVHAGILIGGHSRRMGCPKHLIMQEGATWVERIVAVVQPRVDKIVVLGAGDLPSALHSLPRLPDVTDGEVGGPVRGMRSAMRWSPFASWIFAACDQPGMSSEALSWLLDQRGPGIHAVMPRLLDHAAPEPFPGWYDFRSAARMESIHRPRDLAVSPRTVSPVIPCDLAPAWRNINTPGEVC